MQQQTTVLIGGSTGLAGRELVAHLSEHYPDVLVRALTRSPESEAARSLGDLPRVTVVKGDYGDVRSLDAATAGADGAYLACHNVAEQRQLENGFIDACKRNGVRRLAKVSMFRYFCREQGPGPGAAHHQVEQHLHASGLNHVVLHPAYYFQDLLFFASAIKMAGVLPQLLGDMKVNMVDCRDVAAYAAALLTCDDEAFAPFNGQHVEIAGPEDLGGEDWAEALRNAGVDARYERVSPDAFKQGLLSVGIPEDMADNVTAIHTCFYDGSAQVAGHATTPELAHLPGTPRTQRYFNDFVREVAQIFRP